MPGQLTKLRVSFRKSSFAGLSLTITLFQLSLAIVLLSIGITINEHVGERLTVLICVGTWLVVLLTAIFLTGPRTRNPSDTDLKIFHILPGAMFVVSLPSMAGNSDHLSYMMGFVDFIVLLAMSIYGLICLRNFRQPSPWYLLYLPLAVFLFSKRL